MPDKFNPEDLKNPLYEHSQVVTIYELMAMYRGLADQYKHAKWWQFRLKHDLKIAAHALYEIIKWLRQGKPEMYDPGELQ